MFTVGIKKEIVIVFELGKWNVKDANSDDTSMGQKKKFFVPCSWQLNLHDLISFNVRKITTFLPLIISKQDSRNRRS